MTTPHRRLYYRSKRPRTLGVKLGISETALGNEVLADQRLYLGEVGRLQWRSGCGRALFHGGLPAFGLPAGRNGPSLNRSQALRQGGRYAGDIES